MNIEIKNRPRGSGKTSQIKLRILEYTRKNRPRILYLTHSEFARKEFQNWVREYGLSSHVDTYNLNCELENVIDCIEYRFTNNVKIFIDEPFLIKESIQCEFLRRVKRYVNTGIVEIFGIGTEENRHDNLTTFNDYLE